MSHGANNFTSNNPNATVHAENSTSGAALLGTNNANGPGLRAEKGGGGAVGHAIEAINNADGAGYADAVLAERHGSTTGHAIEALNDASGPGTALMAVRRGSGSGDAVIAAKDSNAFGVALRVDQRGSGTGEAIHAGNASTAANQSGAWIYRAGPGSGIGVEAERLGTGYGHALGAFHNSPAGGYGLLVLHIGGDGSGVLSQRGGDRGHGVIGDCSAKQGDGVVGYRTHHGAGAGVHGIASAGGNVAVRAAADSGAHALCVEGGPAAFNAPTRFDKPVHFNEAVGFSQVGTATIPAGAARSGLISHPLYAADSCVLVSLTSDPGSRASLSWVEHQPAGFVVHLTARAGQVTHFRFFMARPADPAAVPGCGPAWGARGATSWSPEDPGRGLKRSPQNHGEAGGPLLT